MTDMPCEKVVRLEADVANIKERLDDMKGIGDSLSRLTALMEMQQASNEKQNVLIETQSQQLIRLGSTIEKLNDKIDRTDHRVDETSKKIDCLEEARKDDFTRDNLDLRDVRDKFIWIVLGVVFTALAYGFIKIIAENV